jgi:hypothetical protein
LLLLFGREHVNDAVDGIDRANRMQRGYYQMPRFRRGHGRFYRFVVAHFAQKDNVGGLPQTRPQRGYVRFRVGGDFALADKAFIVPVQVLYRVFQCDDMAVPGLVYRVDDTRQCGGLSAARRPRHQHQPVLFVRYLHDFFGYFQFLVIGQLERHDADNRRAGTPLVIRRNTETGNPRQRNGEIVVTVMHEF